VRLAIGQIDIKQRLRSINEETVLQIQKTSYLQFFLGYSDICSRVPFNLSTMVLCRKQFPDDDIRKINELLDQRGKEILIEAAITQGNDDENPSGNAT